MTDTHSDDSMAAWEERLWAAEADLREREERALAEEATPAELFALAAERDKLAVDRGALATAHDERATARDAAGLIRDAGGSGRDRAARRIADDADPGFADRVLSGMDRDYAAGDRSDSYDDRRRGTAARTRAAADRDRAATDRRTAADRSGDLEAEVAGLREALATRLVIGQAEGLLMARYQLHPDAAFALLVRLSQQGNVKLRDLAARIVRDAASSFTSDGPPLP